MRTICKIAKTELQVLFYSPIAWMIIIIFAFQAGMAYSSYVVGIIKVQSMLGYGFPGATESAFADGRTGLFMKMLSSLYLYVPLLTMGLMSREFSSGSIKLLYNSPITNRQIILGKYLSMVVYALILVAILFVFVAFTGITMDHFDWGLCFSGLLGIYLLVCVYSAIGLFMSSLTSYQLVAAICTLSVLAVLNYVRGVWQNIDFVRELTYWLSISGRAQKFIQGLICSEDILYFLIIIALFLCWTIIQLQATRQKSKWSVTWGKFLVLFAGVLVLGYVTSRPKFMFFYDATQTKSQSLTPKTQELIAKLDGGMTIKTYGNIMSNSFGYVASGYRKEDMEMLMPYIRFKPEMEMTYTYYYPKDEDIRRVNFSIDMMNEDRDKVYPSDKLDIPIDSVAEGISVVRIFERENGQKELLPTYGDPEMFPKEENYYAMFRRFLEKSPKIGFLTGHGERSMTRRADRDYRLIVRERSFRQSFINSGVDPYEVTLKREIPSDINILMIVDTRGRLTEQEKLNLQRYIDRGGNLFVALKPQSSEDIKVVLEKLGVKVVPGVLVAPNPQTTPDVVFSSVATDKAEQIGGMLGNLLQYDTEMAAAGCCGLDYSEGNGFEVIPLFGTAEQGVWNEMETTNFVDDTVRLNPKVGEKEKSYVTGLALSRKMGDKTQKILVYGNADYFSNTGLGFRADDGVNNILVINATLDWLTDGYAPVEIVRPVKPDALFDISRENSKWINIFFIGIFPGVLLLFALGLWIMRRGK